MPVPFPGFYQLLLVVFGIVIGALGALGAPLMLSGKTPRRRDVGMGMFIVCVLSIAVAVVLGKAGIG